MDHVKKIPKNFNIIVKKQLLLELNKAVPFIKQRIMETFENELMGVVTDRKSKTNPLFYKDEFEDRLNNFLYISSVDSAVTISVPDMDTFDFSGRLKVLKTIMEGTVGVYVEVSAADFGKVFNKQPTNIDPVDTYVPKKDMIYIIKYNSKVRRAENTILNKKLVRYPFSNSPPIDVLQAGQDYVDENVDTWIDTSIQQAEDTFVQGFGGYR